MHHEVGRAHMDRSGTAPSKNRRGTTNRPFLEVPNASFPGRRSWQKMKVHRKHLTIERVSVGEADFRVQKHDSCGQFFRYQPRHSGHSKRGRVILAWGIYSGKLPRVSPRKALKNFGFENISNEPRRGWANQDNNTRIEQKSWIPPKG